MRKELSQVLTSKIILARRDESAPMRPRDVYKEIAGKRIFGTVCNLLLNGRSYEDALRYLIDEFYLAANDSDLVRKTENTELLSCALMDTSALCIALISERRFSNAWNQNQG